MKLRTLLSVALITVLFSGCEISPKKDDGEELDKKITQQGSTTDESQNQELPEQTQNTTKQLTIDDLDFTLRGICAIYNQPLESSPHWWGNMRSSQASWIDQMIVADDGTPVATFESSDYFKFWGVNYIVKYNDPKQEFIKNHIEDNVLLSCRYDGYHGEEGQIYKMFVPLKISKDWEKTFLYNNTKRNNQGLYVNMLTDLYYKIYLKNYQYYRSQDIAIEKTDQDMERFFPKGIYKAVKCTTYYYDPFSKTVQMIEEQPSTVQSYYYRKLNDLAWDYTDKKVDLLNEIIANNYESYYLYNNGCQENWVCASLFPDATEKLLDDPQFYQGLTYWQQTEELYGSTTGSIKETLVSANPKKYNIDLSLKATHGADTPVSYMDIHQKYAISDSSELEKLSLKIKSKKLYGGTTSPWNLTSSGLAGYYACFNDRNDKEIGCMIVTHFTDKLTIPIRIGMMFDPQSTPELYMVKGASKEFETTYNLAKIVREDLPSVKNRLQDVASISIGAFVTEATPDGISKECVAYVEAEAISLEKVK